MKLKIKTTRLVLLIPVLTAGTIFIASNCQTSTTAKKCEPGLHFTYTDAACWGEQDPSYATCGTGKAQSPINIVDFLGSAQATTNQLTATGGLTYSPAAAADWNVVNNGHTVQVNFTPATPNTISVNGVTYNLKQFHFHTRSEHTINGTSYAMEMHLVHNSPTTGNNAVIGIMLDDTFNPPNNTFMASLLSNLGKIFASSTTGGWPTDTDTPANASGVHTPVAGNGSLDITKILPATKGYYTYTGSLTTPPCTENVAEWIVMKTPQAVSTSTVSNFLKAIGGTQNNRPVQPLNNRVIKSAP